ncbi:hypothetical protein V3C99_010415 [Haemonchus contortus]
MNETVETGKKHSQSKKYEGCKQKASVTAVSGVRVYYTILETFKLCRGGGGCSFGVTWLLLLKNMNVAEAEAGCLVVDQRPWKEFVHQKHFRSRATAILP